MIEPASNGSIKLDTMGRIAAWIKREYKGCLKYVVRQERIRDWRNGRQLPGGCTEPFPSPSPGGYTKETVIRPWVEKWLVARPGEVVKQEDEQVDPKFELQMIELRREQRKEEMEEKRASREYMPRAEHIVVLERFAAAVWSRFWNCVENEVPEKTIVKTREVKEFILGLLPVDFPAEHRTKIEAQLDGIAESVRQAGMSGVDAIQKEFSEKAKEKTNDDAGAT